MPRSGDTRLCVLHENIPGMLTSLTGAVAAEGLNIENMTNKSRGNAAYTILDVTGEVPAAVAEHLTAVNGVLRVRVL